MTQVSEVRLREWCPEDAATIAPIRDDEHLRHWSRMGDDLAAWIELQRSGERGPSRAICVDDDDRALGKIALRLPCHASPATSCDAIRATDHPVGELSYWVLPEARGRGLASGAVRAMMKLAGATTDLRTVVLDIESDNGASLRVAERLGAERREPPRMQPDRLGVPRELVVFILYVTR